MGWGSLLSCRDWEVRRGLGEVLVLTAIMHGVAGDDHRRGHGDGSAPHGELVGDGIVSTAAAGARLTRGGSWVEEQSITLNIHTAHVGTVNSC